MTGDDRPQFGDVFAMPPRRFGPIGQGHRLIGRECAACHVALAIGDALALVPLGPGPDPEQRAKCVAGAPYRAVAVPVHWECHAG